jgi:stage V sporulation protein R
MPQIRTKVMTEGWESFWHYNLLHELDLPDEYHLPFLKTHNLVLRPWGLKINPYHLGFEIFKRIEKDFGLAECFFAREVCNDESFIRQYLNEELARELNLFTYSKKGKGRSGDWTIDDITDDEDSFQEIRKVVMGQVGGNMIPIIYVDEMKDGELILRHEHDGRDLELDYADNSVRMVRELWKGPVKLFTIIEEEDFEVS